MEKLLFVILFALNGLESLVAFKLMPAVTESPIAVGVPPAKKMPLLLVLGQDVSASFEGFDEMGVAQIEEICTKVQQTGRRALICYELVGNANDRSFKRLNLDALPMVEQTMTLTERANTLQKRREIERGNKKAVAIFLRQCADLLLKHTRESSTDLNGFLRKAATLMKEPTFTKYEKLLFIHSDGIQDAENDRVLRVVTAPGTRLFFSGLKPQKAPIRAVLFESPDGFVEYIGRSQ